jgi:hypothetical protein
VPARVSPMALQDARRVALALPEATEQDHHGMASFRVRGKVFATVPDDTHIRVMVDEDEIRAVAAANPASCQELYWGARLSALEVDLRRVRKALVEELLCDAWARKAPRKLVDAFEPGRAT